ncbi:MAG: UPF0164 family protein [Elusimicrobiota bacterium]
MKRIVAALLAFCLSAQTGFCAFKDVNWSVRSSGMGNAFVAVSDDASSSLINPAGIIQIERGEADFMYTKLFNGMENVDLALQYASVVHSLGKYGNMGVTWAYFDTRDIYNESTIAYTHAIDITRYYPSLPKLFLGTNIKFLSHGYTTDPLTENDPVFKDGTRKWNITADIGALGYPMPSKAPDFTVGLTVKNITQPDVGLQSKDIVPMEIQGGVALKSTKVNLFKILKLNDVLWAADVNYRFQEWGRTENKLSASLGVECWVFNKTIGLRAGAGTREASAGVSFKFGVAKDLAFRFDYAANFPIYLTGSSGHHRGSFLVKF